MPCILVQPGLLWLFNVINHLFIFSDFPAALAEPCIQAHEL